MAACVRVATSRPTLRQPLVSGVRLDAPDQTRTDALMARARLHRKGLELDLVGRRAVPASDKQRHRVRSGAQRAEVPAQKREGEGEGTCVADHQSDDADGAAVFHRHEAAVRIEGLRQDAQRRLSVDPKGSRLLRVPVVEQHGEGPPVTPPRRSRRDLRLAPKSLAADRAGGAFSGALRRTHPRPLPARRRQTCRTASCGVGPGSA